MDSSSLRRLRSSPACTGDLRQACALRRLSSRAVCITCGLRRPSCIRLAADITFRLAPSCYILQSPCPALPTAFAPSYPGQFSQRFNFGLAPSAALSGRASNQLQACALGSSSARTGDQLQLSSRAAHLARPQCNSWLAPQVTRLWQRRLIEHLTYALCSNPSAKLATRSRLSVAATSPACAGCLLPSTSVP